MIKRSFDRRFGEKEVGIITFEEDVNGKEERVGIPADALMEALREIPEEDLPSAKVEVLSYVRGRKNGNVRRIRVTTSRK